MIPPKRVDIFPPDWGGCLEGLDAFRFFFKYLTIYIYFIQYLVVATWYLVLVAVQPQFVMCECAFDETIMTGTKEGIAPPFGNFSTVLPMVAGNIRG